MAEFTPAAELTAVVKLTTVVELNPAAGSSAQQQ